FPRYLQQDRPDREVLLLGDADAQALRPVLGHPQYEGAVPAGGDRALREARGDFPAATGTVAALRAGDFIVASSPPPSFLFPHALFPKTVPRLRDIPHSSLLTCSRGKPAVVSYPRTIAFRCSNGR